MVATPSGRDPLAGKIPVTLVTGFLGAGKTTVAAALVSKIVGKTPYVLHIVPDGNTISIETVRQLREFVRLKTTGTSTWRRAIIIEDAHKLTREAQNAFLKLLEEPPADTLIVLTATSQTSLLPTITSRAQKITIKPLVLDDVASFFEQQGYDSTQITKSFYMSGGQMGLMTRLLDVDNNQDLLKHIDNAKQMLQAKAFERLVFIDQYLKQKETLENLLWGLLTVSKVALHQAGQQGKQQMVKHWQRVIEAVLEAQDALPAHPLPKLLLTDLSLRL